MSYATGRAVAPAAISLDGGRRIGWEEAFRLIGAVNIALLLTLLVGRTLYDHLGFRLASLFGVVNLGAETNLAAWWSGTLLLTASFCFGLCAVRRSLGLRAPWIILSALWALLSFDEVGSLHERLTSFTDGPKALALWSMAALIILGGGYAGLRLLLHPGGRRCALYLLTGALLDASVVLQEFVEHRVEWPAWSTGLRAMVEEGTELLASLFVLKGVSGILRETGFALPSRRPVLIGLTLALLLNGLLVVHYSSGLTDIPGRGDPGAWFPFAVFLGLAGWTALEGRGRAEPARFAVPLILLMLSTVPAVQYSRAWPLMNLPVGLELGAPLIWMLIWPCAMLAGIRPSGYSVMLALLLPLSSLLVGLAGADALILSLTAYVYALVFLNGTRAPAQAGAAA
ncbi:MAG: hypothetical protein QM690_13530 [Sphingobium sp.]